MKEYEAIKTYYYGKTSVRGGQPYMKHIDDGLILLDEMKASDVTKKAFCLHPLVQDDADLIMNYPHMKEYNPDAVLLAMEYRRVANLYLPKRYIKNISEIELSPLPEVNQMLMADKIQNYKDFYLYSAEKMPVEQQNRLEEYFYNWFYKLFLLSVYAYYNGRLQGTGAYYDTLSPILENGEIVGFYTYLSYKGNNYVSHYILEHKRKAGRYKHTYMENFQHVPVLTTDKCGLASYLKENNIPYHEIALT